MTFKNKVVWITGASSGIGEALVYMLAEKGAKLIISSRRAHVLEQVKANCKTEKKNVYVLPLDLLKHDELPEKCQKALSKFGRIDYLFNNGGVSQRSLAVETDISVVKKIMDINYTGTVAVTSGVLKSMINQQSGHIIVTSSVMGKFGTPKRSAYVASKHALQGYFDSLRYEVMEHNIYVTLVCPGFIHTDVSVNALTGDGSHYQKMAPGQKNGMEPNLFAKKMLKSVEKKKKEVFIGGKEILSIYLKRFTPSVLDWLIAKVDTT